MSKYQTIMDDLMRQIEQGQLTEGSKLPSIRQLSQNYDCTKETVQKALVQLKHLHYIYPIAKSGYYVLASPQQEERDITLPLSKDDYRTYEDFRLCLNESLIGRENHLFNYYGKAEGLEELIKALQKQLVASHVYCKPQQIAVTAGTQQALYILSQIQFPNQKSHILLEQPTYHRMNQLVKALALPHMTIERTLQGIDLQALETLFKTGNIKFFYTMPRLHMPLGTSYSLEEKKAILALAQTYDVYIIEDDYMGDLASSQALPLHYYDTHNRVIYIRSYSASIFPALRLASLVLPPNLIHSFLSHKQLMDYDANLILQQALALYLESGLFEKNRSRLQEHHHLQLSHMKEVLEEVILPYPYHIAYSSLLIELPEQAPIASLQHSGMPIDLLQANYLTPRYSRYLSLHYDSNFQQHIETITSLLSK